MARSEQKKEASASFTLLYIVSQVSKANNLLLVNYDACRGANKLRNLNNSET